MPQLGGGMEISMEKELNRSLNFKDVLILAFSTMIGWGWGWVSLTGTWAFQGGALGASLVFALGAVLCIFVGLTYFFVFTNWSKFTY